MKCPGQDTQYWNEDAIFETECPECGHTMEFFKDDATRRCPNCQKKIVNPKMDFGCASYCKFAEQCLGTLPEDFVAKRDDLFKDRVAVEVKRYLGTDFKRIGHAARMAGLAEKIAKREKADLPSVLCAAYLYEIGARLALEKHGSDDSRWIEQENPGMVQILMDKLGAGQELIDRIIEMVRRHGRPSDDADLERRVLWDADQLARMSVCKEKVGIDPAAFLSKLDRIFMTPSGKELAGEILMKQR